MVDLSTSYLGLDLASPLVPSSSPLTGTLDSARRLEDAGAAAIVMPSLFEEEILADDARLERYFEQQELGHAEADSYRPLPPEYRGCEARYLETLASLKRHLDIPVIASINGVSDGGWIEHARALQEAGADALEMNVYYLAADITDTAASVEQRYVDVATALRSQVTIPVAAKLTSQLTAPLDLVRRLDGCGVHGVSLFNRFYQPDIDLDSLLVTPQLSLSTADEALLRIRWTAMLHGHTRCDIAVTGGFHGPREVLKALLAGANVVHLCSVLLQHGPQVLREIEAGMRAWLEEHEYDSVKQLLGSVSERHAPNPAAYARANYLQLTRSTWPVGSADAQAS